MGRQVSSAGNNSCTCTFVHEAPVLFLVGQPPCRRAVAQQSLDITVYVPNAVALLLSRWLC